MVPMKFIGLNQTEIDQFEQLRLQLRRAQQAAVNVATDYEGSR